ncbi:MAG: tetratricopeptide repeat protein [Lentisphaerota bacterium]
MLRKIGVIGMSLVFAAGVWADYPADRKAAAELARAGKKDQALEAFLKLADTSTSDVQKSDALQQAIECVDNVKQYDRAMEIAKKIPVASISKNCQMQIMENGRKWNEIVENFKDEDISTWPDSVKGDALLIRGTAYYNVQKDGKKAEEDLKKASESLVNSNSKGVALNLLGDTYKNLLKDDSKALEAYRKTYSTDNVYKHCYSAIGVASILKQQQKYDEALQELNKIFTAEVTSSFWRGRMLRTMGDVLAASGKKDEAIAKYNEALKLKDLPQEIKEECENSLKAVQP